MENLHCSLKIQELKKRTNNIFNDLIWKNYSYGSFTEKNIVRL